MSAKVLAAGASLMLLCGCVSIQRFEPAAIGNQTCEIVNNVKICTSKQMDSTFMVSINRSRDGFMPLLVLAANESPGPFAVSPTDIEITCKDDVGNFYRQVKVYGPRELANKINAQQGWQKAGLGLSQAKRAEAAGAADRSDIYRKAYAEKSALAQQQTMESAEFLNGILRATTLYPGQYISGTVWAEYVKADTYFITFKMNNDIHTVEFRRVGE